MTNQEQEIYQFWQEKDIFGSNAIVNKRQIPYIFWDLPFGSLSAPEVSDISTFLLRDSIAKYQTQSGKTVILKWGWNSHLPTLESFTASQYPELKGQALHDKCLDISSSANSQWQELIRTLGGQIDPSSQYTTGDSEYIQSVWWGLGQLWQKNLLKSQYQVSLYSPALEASLGHHQVAQEVVWQEQSQITPILRMRVVSESARALLRKIEEEINFQYTEQIKIKNDIERRLLQIKEISTLGRKGARGNIFNGGDNPSFQGIDWENFRTDQEVAGEVYSLREKLETVLENVDTLARLKLILTRSCPLSLLTWVVSSWSLPANSCLAVNPEAEYSMYFLEASGELVILAEERSIPVLSLQLHDAVVNSPEIEEELEGITDGGEYFEKLGVRIIKIVSFSGEDLEGLEYIRIFEPSSDIEPEELANCYKVYVDSAVKSDEGTGIIAVSPAYGKLDFGIKQAYNLPIINCLDGKGQLMSNQDQELATCFGMKFDQIGDIITGILDKKRLVFASIRWSHRVPILTSNQSGLYYLASENWYFGQPSLIDKAVDSLEEVSFHKPNHKRQLRQQIELTKDQSITSNHSWGTPLPIWQGADRSQQILVDSITKLEKYAVNPIFRLLNTKALIPDLYLDGKIAIVTDNLSRLPLGINAVQYRSKAFSAMRRERTLTSERFNLMATELLTEILELFQRYNSVQILFNETEQVMWTSFLSGDYSNGSKVSSDFYFFKPVLWNSGSEEWQITGKIQYLDFHQSTLDQIILRDKVGNIYRRLPFILDNWVDIASSTWAAWEYPSPDLIKVGVATAVDSASNLTSKLYAGHLLATGGMNQKAFENTIIAGRTKTEDNLNVINSLDEYSSDSLRFYLARSGCWQGSNIKFQALQWRQTYNSLDRRLTHILSYINIYQTKNKILLAKSDNPKHILNKWLNIVTTQLVNGIKEALDNQNFKEAASLIDFYIDLVCNKYLRLIKHTPSVSLPENLSCLRRNLLILATVARSLTPFLSEKIWLSLAGSDMTDSVHLSTWPNLSEVLPKQIQLVDKVTSLLGLITKVNQVRGRISMALAQPLYAQIKDLDMDTSLMEIFTRSCSLIERDMTNLEGQTVSVESDFGNFKIDLVVDQDLHTLAMIRQFERACQNLRRIHNFQYGEVVSMKWQIINIGDDELVASVIKQINWARLYVDIKWVKDLDEETSSSFTVPGLVKILVG